VHALGTVVAKTWQKSSGTFPLAKRVETDDGQRKSRYSFYFGNWKLPLHGSGAPFETYRTETESTPLRLWGDLYLPITFEKSVVYSTNVRYEILSPEEAASYYGPTLLEKMEMPADGEIINTEYTHILNGDGTVTVTCTAECLEEIGETREILEGTENDGTIF